MSHNVEFSIPFSEIESFAKGWAEQKGIQLPDNADFDFRVERDRPVGFAIKKPDALGVRVETK